MKDIINLEEKFHLITDYWSPKIISCLNGQLVKIAKVKGDFVWHDHQDQDELFYIVKGTLKIEMKSKTVTLNKGEIYIVPKGIQHKPTAKEECWIMLFEPVDTRHTGTVKSELTRDQQDWI